MAIVHHDEPVAIGNGVTHIVGDHHGGQVILFHDALCRLQNLGGGLWIQGGGVLVQQQQLRLLEGRHQQGQCLALAAGKQADLGGHTIFQPQIQNFQLLDIVFPVRGGNALFQGAPLAPAVRQRQIFLDLHGGGSAHHGILKHTAQVRRPLEFRKPGDIPAVQNDRAGIHLNGACHGIQHGRLARAVAADNRNKVPIVQSQIQAVQGRLCVDRTGVEGLADIFDLKHCGRLPSSCGHCPSSRGWTGTMPRLPR